MKLHMLPGDATLETFREAGIVGDIAVCRECLVDGDVSGATLEEFWRTRAGFIGSTYGGAAEEYFDRVATEFNKLLHLGDGDSVFLWFEYELFCQANYWFVLDLLAGTKADVFRVSPIVRDDEDKWKGFGNLSPDDIGLCFASRLQLTESDIEHGSRLWRAFRENDAERLRDLSAIELPAFPLLHETAEAAIAREHRPRAILREILEEGTDEFGEVFRKFSDRAGVYGYGDAQVKRILENM